MAASRTARRVARATCVACLVLGAWTVSARADAPPSRPVSHLAYRLGIVRTTLEGAVARTYPDAGSTGRLGVAWRVSRGPVRLRTGLEWMSVTGSGSVPVTGLSDSAGVFGQHVVGHIGERWSTTWVELPVRAEFAFGAGAFRPYVSAGAALAKRLNEHRQHAYELEPNDARAYGASAGFALGGEWRLRQGVTRVELGFEHGLQRLYEAGHGPAGGWGSWNLVVDVSP